MLFFCTAIFFVTLSCLNANGFFGNIVKEKSPIRWQNMSTVGYRKKGGGGRGKLFKSLRKKHDYARTHRSFFHSLCFKISVLTTKFFMKSKYSSI